MAATSEPIASPEPGAIVLAEEDDLPRTGNDIQDDLASE